MTIGPAPARRDRLLQRVFAAGLVLKGVFAGIEVLAGTLLLLFGRQTAAFAEAASARTMHIRSEPVAAGLARAGLLLAIGPAPARESFFAAWPETARPPRLDGLLAPLVTGMDWAGLRALAFAGIGRPGKFFATLRAEGADVVATRSFDDHAPYDARILARLLAEARTLGARLVTTEKDAARLPPAFRAEVLTLPVRLVLEDDAPLDAALARLGL